MQVGFDNALVLVTGGASGIGESCVRLFRRCNARVIAADRDEAGARQVADDCAAASARLDVGDTDEVKAAIGAIAEAHGPIDVLVNSAGILQRTLPPGELSIAEWDLVAKVDLRGTYLCCAMVGTQMAQRRRGSIVNIASVAGMRSGPLHSYGPAKAGVISLTECLAAEWGPAGVRVNAVSPGFTRTPALERGLERGVLDERRLAGASALQRLVEAEEVAAAVVFLASDLAAGITGINLPVDAGYLVATPWQSYGGLRGGEKMNHES
jgi:NAD(P)-dependent dehydrogenase (short-subunit alcohol dehydrogenase family)